MLVILKLLSSSGAHSVLSLTLLALLKMMLELSAVSGERGRERERGREGREREREKGRERETPSLTDTYSFLFSKFLTEYGLIHILTWSVLEKVNTQMKGLLRSTVVASGVPYAPTAH